MGEAHKGARDFELVGREVGEEGDEQMREKTQMRERYRGGVGWEIEEEMLV